MVRIMVKMMSSRVLNAINGVFSPCSFKQPLDMKLKLMDKSGCTYKLTLKFCIYISTLRSVSMKNPIHLLGSFIYAHFPTC